jgi:hypothetical protein
VPLRKSGARYGVKTMPQEKMASSAQRIFSDFIGASCATSV